MAALNCVDEIMAGDEKLTMIEWVAAVRPLHGQMMSGDMRMVQPGFKTENHWIETSQPGANEILSRHFKGNDYALALVV